MSRKLSRKLLVAGVIALGLASLLAGTASAANTGRATPAQYEKTRTAAPDYTRNLLARCQRFNGEQRSLCEQQIMDGPIQGSVNGGGILYAPAVIETIQVNM
ncbi:MAG: hypothetical protein NC211_01475 [Alistipes senegalensis]|nr:hypothetical protein [Oxalobacter formigenes]MCM1280495.1 hypothetical protein [Alistipes senegalensis]